VGSTVFAHGGVLKTHVRRGLRRANRETSEWLAGSSGNALVPPLHVTGADSVVWARHYSHPDSWKCDCDALEEALRALPGMRRVVVGHTIPTTTIVIIARRRKKALRRILRRNRPSRRARLGTKYTPTPLSLPGCPG
jgi:hypothetical protein